MSDLSSLEILSQFFGAELWPQVCERALEHPSVSAALKAGMSLETVLERIRAYLTKPLRPQSGYVGTEAPASATATLVVNGMGVLVTARAGEAAPEALSGLVMNIYSAAQTLVAQGFTVGLSLDGRHSQITWLNPGKQADPAAHPDKVADTLSASEDSSPQEAPESSHTHISSLRIMEVNGRKLVEIFTREGGKYPDITLRLPSHVRDFIGALERIYKDTDQFLGKRVQTPGLHATFVRGKKKERGEGHYLNYLPGSVWHGNKQ
ncbi:MAG: hypothetical protein KatS3mg038_1025 [Candidatus Kapaibacterium sp.]|nr:MAG: hypothetical protein KatS3mg038_1025 [Candidatus Kapabacteria bacterium]